MRRHDDERLHVNRLDRLQAQEELGALVDDHVGLRQNADAFAVAEHAEVADAGLLEMDGRFAQRCAGVQCKQRRAHDGADRAVELPGVAARS